LATLATLAASDVPDVGSSAASFAAGWLTGREVGFRFGMVRVAPRRAGFGLTGFIGFGLGGTTGLAGFGGAVLGLLGSGCGFGAAGSFGAVPVGPAGCPAFLARSKSS
jgi:hypothetical protein